MRKQKVRRRLCLMLLTVGLCGCVPPPARITSYLAKDGHVEIRRLMVVVAVMQYKANVVPYGIRASAFETAFRDSLGKCGIDVSFLFQDQFSAIAGSAEAVRIFSPDALLSVDRNYVEGEQRYSADMIVMATKKIAWRADIVVHEGRRRDEALAAAIVDRLKSDAVLDASCSKPETQRRAR